MINNRRDFIARTAGTGGLVAMYLAKPRPAQACLLGTWFLYCRNCHHIDTVEDGTCQHKCENCGQQVFYGTDGRDVTLVCEDGHLNPVTTGTHDHPSTSYKCTSCGKDCQQDE
jgi:hypothetical protein